MPPSSQNDTGFAGPLTDARKRPTVVEAKTRRI
jgi:hypothetical protein